MLVKTYRLRLYFLYIIPVAAMLGLVVRLYYVQVKNRPYYERLAKIQHFDEYKITPMRGKIFDTNGHELVGNVILDKAHININHLPKNNEEALTKLASALAQKLNDPKMGYDEILRRLQGKVNRWPFLARDINDKMKMELRATLASEELKKLGISSSLLSFVPQNKRRYTRPLLAPHIIGYTRPDDTGDNLGVEGVERTFNDVLRGKERKYVARQTATGNPMEPADPELVESTFGQSIRLTIDESIQAVTQNVLQQGVEKSNADSGVAVCMKVKTGEILSMASYPSYSLTNVGGASPEQRRNRALTDAIEPGSVMKIITFASLFDANKVEPFDYINCNNGTWIVPGIGRPIKDSKSLGMATVAQVFQYSSNIGTIKAARAFTDAEFYTYLKRFGFGERTGIELGAESPGMLSHPKDWTGYTMSSIPMGYEIQLNAVQVTAAVAAIANKGMYMKPHVVKEILDHNGETVRKIEPELVRNVISPEASRKVVDLMELVVEKGTAKAAQLDGYRVGGKTGTTRRLNPETRLYEKSYIASFCGIAPIEDPEVAIYVYVDNPRGDKFYGGQISAPIFREIAREAMRVMRIPEHRPEIPEDFIRKTLAKVRNEIDGRVPVEVLSDFGAASSDEPSLDTVPDLQHLTLKEAAAKAAAANVELRVTGSGIVVDQNPPANETIEGERVVHVTLVNADDFIGKLVDDYAALMELEDTNVARPGGVGRVQPVTSVSLRLDTGSQSVAIPVEGSGGQELPKPPGFAPVPGQADAVADIEADPEGETFEDFSRNLKELEKRHEVRQRPARELITSEVPQNERVNSGPIPEIDGSDELDPTAQPIVPIDIETPVRRDSDRDSRQDSLYNLLQ